MAHLNALVKHVSYILGHPFSLRVSKDFQKANLLQTKRLESNPNKNSGGGLVVGLALQKRLLQRRANDEEANLAITAT